MSPDWLQTLLFQFVYKMIMSRLTSHILELSYQSHHHDMMVSTTDLRLAFEKLVTKVKKFYTSSFCKPNVLRQLGYVTHRYV